jgi:conserved hypothetical protein
MKHVLLIVRIAFASGLFSWFFVQCNPAAAISLLLKISPVAIVLVLCIDCLAILVGTYKWKLLLPEINIYKLFNISMIGRFYSFVLPGQIAGEAVKAYYLGKDVSDIHKISASVIVDKITGFIGTITVGIAGVFLSGTFIFNGIILYLISAIFGLLLLLSLMRTTDLQHWFSGIMNKMRMKQKGIIGMIISNLTKLFQSWTYFINKTNRLIFNIILGICFQGLGILIVTILARSIGICLSFFTWSWVFGIVVIAMLFPITIAGLGIREGILIGILGMLSITREKALAISLLILALQVFSVTIGGIFEIVRTVRKRVNGPDYLH